MGFAPLARGSLRWRLTGPAVLLAGGIVSFGSGSAPTSVLAHPGVTTSVTWTRDVSRIVERRCAACHRESGPGPMDLTTYEAARPWARAIREEVLERRMPPTGLRSGAGLFSNARNLSWAESELLVSWADGGAPNGDPLEHAPTEEPQEWTSRASGEPLPAAPELLTRTFRVPVVRGWIAAWKLDPGDWPIASALLREDRGAIVGRWAPGDPPVAYPSGVGYLVPPGGPLFLEATLSRPPLEGELGSPPSLSVRSVDNARRSLSREVLSSQPAMPARKGDSLLGFRLALDDPDAEADLVLTSKNGDETFLLAMGPPGVPDPVLYRLREPLLRNPGDVLEVRTKSRFELEVESVAGAVSPRAASRR